MADLKTHFYSAEDHPSNFYHSSLVWRERVWLTAEHAYQAAKFFETAPEVSEAIRAATSPREAKALSKEYREQRDPLWSTKKLAVMEDILRAKLDQGAFREMLVATDGEELVEDSPEDDYWGAAPDGKGENHLGRLWMKLRKELLQRNPGDGKLKT